MKAASTKSPSPNSEEHLSPEEFKSLYALTRQYGVKRSADHFRVSRQGLLQVLAKLDARRATRAVIRARLTLPINPEPPAAA